MFFFPGQHIAWRGNLSRVGTGEGGGGTQYVCYARTYLLWRLNGNGRLWGDGVVQTWSPRGILLPLDGASNGLGRTHNESAADPASSPERASQGLGGLQQRTRAAKTTYLHGRLAIAGTMIVGTGVGAGFGWALFGGVGDGDENGKTVEDDSHATEAFSLDLGLKDQKKKTTW